MKFAIISTDSNVDYSFVSPVSALVWREVIGIEPIVYTVGNEKEWNDKPKARTSLAQLDEWNISRKFINAVDEYRSSTVAQVSRMFAAADPFDSDDMLITTDADMWPLSRQWFEQIQNDKLTLFYGNAYGTDRFPMCYISGKAGIWRDILSIQAEGISKVVTRHLMMHLHPKADDGTAWHHDEIFLGGKIKSWSGYPSMTHIVNRYGDPPNDRIDRACWPAVPNISSAVDAHLCRPIYDHNIWHTKHRPILAQILNQKLMRSIDEYEDKHSRA